MRVDIIETPELGLLAPDPDRIGSPAAGSVQRPAPG
jgi:hypothetical protein